MHGCRRKSWHHDVDERSDATSAPTSPDTVDGQDTVTGRVQTCPSSASMPTHMWAAHVSEDAGALPTHRSPPGRSAAPERVGDVWPSRDVPQR